jgi:hypothetical protein
MKNYLVHVTGASLYSQSKPHQVEKLERETAEAYERRTWKSRLHVNKDGEIYIPAMAFKNCLSEAAKYLSKPVPGKGKSTYTKNFEAGVLVLQDAVIHGSDGKPLLAEDCDKKDSQIWGDWIFTPSDGVPGGGKRVYRCYPVISDPWTCDVPFTVADDLITQSVLEEHLKIAGLLIGLGRFRVRNRGTYGRFGSEVLSVQDLEVA